MAIKTMSESDVQALSKRIDKAVAYTNSGLNDDVAVEKVAREEKLTPSEIRLLGTTYNKIKSVQFLQKASSEDRDKVFPIVDPDKVVRNVYSKDECDIEKAASVLELPIEDYSDIVVKRYLEKKASEADTRTLAQRIFGSEITAGNICILMQKTAAVEKAMFDELQQRVTESFIHFNRSLEKVAGHVKEMDDKEYKRFADRVVSGYTDHGPRMVQVISACAGRECPPLNKIANSIKFPTCEPYISLADAYLKANEVVNNKHALQSLQKKAEADGPIQNFMSNFSADKMGVLGLSDSDTLSILQGAKKSDKDVADVLDPEFFNALKELDGRRLFTTLALYDQDLNKYKFDDLLKAYNTSVATVPQAINNETILRNLMLRNLETGGTKDPFELKTELDMSKTLADMYTAEETLDLKRKELLARKEDAKARAKESSKMPSYSERLRNILGKAPEHKKGTDSGKQKSKDDSDKKYMESAKDIYKDLVNLNGGSNFRADSDLPFTVEGIRDEIAKSYEMGGLDERTTPILFQMNQMRRYANAP